MRLRGLELKDVKPMLEWMHDASVTEHLRTNFASMTEQNVEAFIRQSWTSKSDIHKAIVSDNDVYMGTVSLKNIENGDAEFSIVLRAEAMRKGYSWFGMEKIIMEAFEDYGLNSVYWCVSRDNRRAISFYDKHNYHEVVDVPKRISDRYAGMDNLKWYAILKGDIIREKAEISICTEKHIKTISTIHSGELSFFEAFRDIPFEIKRIYYISKVPKGVKRGFHAHKKLKQILFCPYGRIRFEIENKNGKETFELADPSIAIVLDEITWREMLWLQDDSVLCVAASDYYDPDDYIRDYEEFKQYIQGGNGE